MRSNGYLIVGHSTETLLLVGCILYPWQFFITSYAADLIQLDQLQREWKKSREIKRNTTLKSADCIQNVYSHILTHTLMDIQMTESEWRRISRLVW